MSARRIAQVRSPVRPTNSSLVAVLICIFVMLNSSLLAIPSTYGAFPNTATPIKHVIIVMQENHSFDNYFGTYPTANGTLNTQLTSQLQPVSGIPKGVCLAAPTDRGCVAPSLANSSSVPNPNEGQLTYEKDWNNGSMNGFAQNSGPQSMLYFDYHHIPAYWDYAEQYGIANNYFAPVLSTTLPNRLMLIEGDSQFAGTSTSSAGLSQLFGALVTSYSKTIFAQLTLGGVSWDYFDILSSKTAPGEQNGTGSSSSPFSFATNVLNASKFFGDLSSGNLPQVSFVNSLGSTGLDELSPNSVTAGQNWVVQVVNAVMQSSYWNSTAIFLTWDEGGGYYDHVAPPQVLTINHGFNNPLIGYGQRVPMIVISPYSKENYVSQTVLTHMSLDKFIEYNFGLSALNQNVANSHNLLDFFNFNASPRPPIMLQKNSSSDSYTFPMQLQEPLSQLTYSRTGSYTGNESLPSGTGGILPSSPGQFVLGALSNTVNLFVNLATGKASLITLEQILSLVFVVFIVVVLLVVVAVVRRLTRRRTKHRTRP